MRCNLIALLMVTTGLAACGTPQEQCISRNTQELRTVTLLLAEIQGNLDRGYAWEERQVTRTEWDECVSVLRTRDGKAQTVSRPCLRDVTETERYRVPIDPVIETRKRDNLAAKKRALDKNTPAILRACQAAFPE